MSDWPSPLWDRIKKTQANDGGWPYAPGRDSAPEPTALACIALAADGQDSRSIHSAVGFLSRRQCADGSVPAVADVPASSWPTALAIIAFHAAREWTPEVWNQNAPRAIDWLLRAEGKPFVSDPRIYGHDTQLVGWGWIDGTHSWLEPTALAMLALRAAGQTSHRRYREGSRLLRNRAVGAGGWNYGNGRMFGADLRPFPETTGIALTALAGEPRDPVVDASLGYLIDCTDTMSAPLAIAWTVLALRAWNQPSVDHAPLLERAATRRLNSAPRPTDDAMLLIAAMSACPLLPANRTEARRNAELAEARV